jgi:predicted dehydrogenase
MGGVGQNHLMVASHIRALRVIGVAESHPAPRLLQYLAVPLHRDWRALIADDTLDAVSICLPHHLHAEVAIAALQAGKHVLLEKPIADTWRNSQRIVAAARVAKRTLMIEMTHRFYAPVQQAQEFVRSGRLGRIYAVEDRIIQRTPRFALPRWIYERKKAGGGVAITNGIHMLDRIAFVCGQPLRFLDGTAGWTQRLGDIEDTASMQLELADGAPVHLLAAWPVGDKALDDELTVYGARGTVRVWAWRGWRFESIKGVTREVSCHAGAADPGTRSRLGMGAALREFASAILERREPNPTAREVLAAQEIIEQFYRRAGRKP